MPKRIERIAPLQFGIVAGICYALLSLVIVPFFILFALISAFIPHQDGSGGALAAGIGLGMSLVFAVLAPIFYGVAGFIFGAIGALIYNLVAGWVGGIEFVAE